jgi:hypothetical protein
MSSQALKTTANICWLLAFLTLLPAMNGAPKMLLLTELFLVLWFICWLCGRRQHRLESLPKPIRPEDYQSAGTPEDNNERS